VPLGLMDGQLTELSEFLSLDQRIDVKASALDYVLGFTGNDEGCQLIMSNATFVNKLLDLTTDRESLISRDAFLALLNLSANDESATKLNQLNVISQFLQMLTQPSHSSHIKQLSMLISNLTRQTIGTLILINSLTSSDHSVNLTHLIDMFDKTADNDTVDYLAPVFSNITQDSKARQMFLDQRHTHVPRLMSYVGHQSLVRRGGTIGCLRNLTFEVGRHQCECMMLYCLC
jgi:superfamily I DNA/RNA helicase